jgi:hypothetical protein
MTARDSSCMINTNHLIPTAAEEPVKRGQTSSENVIGK